MPKSSIKGKEGNSSTSDFSNNDSKTSNKRSSDKEKFLKELRNRISKLSYEESLHQLDLILEQLKNESLPVQELQRSFLEGNLHIEHCTQLLDQVEQEVMEINLD